MKILFIVPIYIHDIVDLKTLYLIGGGGRYPYELAKNIASLKKGEVEIVFFSNKDESIMFDGMKISVVRGFNFLKKFNGPSNPVPVSKAFFQKIKEADIIHGYQIRTEAILLASLFARFVKKPIVLTDTNFNGASFSRIICPEFIADGVLAISSEDYDSWHAKRKEIIYGGVTMEDFPYKKNKKPYILYFGRILSHKGVDVLVEAMPASYELIIAGSALDIAYLDYLKKISKGKKVTFLTNTTDKKMIELYQNATCFVLPATSKDYLGKVWKRPGLYALVVPEAMSCGTPVMVSNVGALPDFIEKGSKINGFVFKDRDINDLQTKLKKLIKDKVLVEKLGKNGRGLVESKYDWQVIARNVYRIYGKFIT